MRGAAQHLQIFEHYYPPVFSDWWMDDWITHVYGPSRTRRGPFVVRHHTGHQGTRYEVDQSHEGRLELELQAGRSRIERWMLQQEDGGLRRFGLALEVAQRQVGEGVGQLLERARQRARH